MIIFRRECPLHKKQAYKSKLPEWRQVHDEPVDAMEKDQRYPDKPVETFGKKTDRCHQLRNKRQQQKNKASIGMMNKVKVKCRADARI